MTRAIRHRVWSTGGYLDFSYLPSSIRMAAQMNPCTSIRGMRIQSAVPQLQFYSISQFLKFGIREPRSPTVPG
jgi:hypothetical protein